MGHMWPGGALNSFMSIKKYVFSLYMTVECAGMNTHILVCNYQLAGNWWTTSAHTSAGLQQSSRLWSPAGWLFFKSSKDKISLKKTFIATVTNKVISLQLSKPGGSGAVLWPHRSSRESSSSNSSLTPFPTFHSSSTSTNRTVNWASL